MYADVIKFLIPENMVTARYSEGSLFRLRFG